MKASRTAAHETPNRSASPRDTPAIQRPSRGRVHSRAGGGRLIQLVQAAQRVAPGWFSVRQYGQIISRSPPWSPRRYACRGALFRPAEEPHPEAPSVAERDGLRTPARQAVVVEEPRQLVRIDDPRRLVDELDGLRRRGGRVAAGARQDDGAGAFPGEPLGDAPDEHLGVQVLEEQRRVDEVEAPGRRPELLRLRAEELEARPEVEEPLPRDPEVLQVHVDADDPLRHRGIDVLEPVP